MGKKTLILETKKNLVIGNKLQQTKKNISIPQSWIDIFLYWFNVLLINLLNSTSTKMHINW